ncbi:MAG: hypothetical protein O3A63_13345 [Proteobacteria bacterium]|nr:hypothetical protein [Pseudomonadota bacterium]
MTNQTDPTTLVPILASLLRAGTDSIVVSRIQEGLTHQSFHAAVADRSFFVKVYPPDKDIHRLISRQNKVMAYMPICTMQSCESASNAARP